MTDNVGYSLLLLLSLELHRGHVGVGEKKERLDKHHLQYKTMKRRVRWKDDGRQFCRGRCEMELCVMMRATFSQGVNHVIRQDMMT